MGTVSPELPGQSDVVISITEAPESSAIDGENSLLSSDLSLPYSQRPKRPSLPFPTLRVEQLREEGCSSPGSSAYNSEDSEFSDNDIISRLGEFVPPSDELCEKIAEQVMYNRITLVDTNSFW